MIDSTSLFSYDRMDNSNFLHHNRLLANSAYNIELFNYTSMAYNDAERRL